MVLLIVKLQIVWFLVGKPKLNYNKIKTATAVRHSKNQFQNGGHIPSCQVQAL